mgnify:FL=1
MTVTETLDRYEVQGHEIVEKTVKPAGTGAIAYVPKRWRGERVKVVRITDSPSED